MCNYSPVAVPQPHIDTLNVANQAMSWRRRTDEAEEVQKPGEVLQEACRTLTALSYKQARRSTLTAENRPSARVHVTPGHDKRSWKGSSSKPGCQRRSSPKLFLQERREATAGPARKAAPARLVRHTRVKTERSRPA